MNIKIDIRALPCVFTLANLLFGFLAIIFSFEKDVKVAASMILLSVLMDSLDGKIARKFQANSDFGKELDSLSDVISFGLAPAVLSYVFVFETQLSFWGLWISAFFAMAGALRLARFNVLANLDYFLGIPITFAGGLVALMLFFQNSVPWQVYPITMLVLGALMISSIRVPKLGK